MRGCRGDDTPRRPMPASSRSASNWIARTRTSIEMGERGRAFRVGGTERLHEEAGSAAMPVVAFFAMLVIRHGDCGVDRVRQRFQPDCSPRAFTVPREFAIRMFARGQPGRLVRQLLAEKPLAGAARNRRRACCSTSGSPGC